MKNIFSFIQNMYGRIHVLLLMIFLLSISLGYIGFSALVSKVELTIDNESHKYYTTAADISTFLKEKDIIINQEDLVMPDINTPIGSGLENKCVIKKAIPVTIVIDGKKLPIYTQTSTISQLLSELDIILEGNYTLQDYNENSALTQNMIIELLEINKDQIG